MKAELIPIYEEECRKLGREPGYYTRPSPRLPISIHLSEDPDRSWALLEKHAVHVVTAYAKWAEEEQQSSSPFAGMTDPVALRKAGLFAVWTPDQLVENVDWSLRREPSASSRCWAVCPRKKDGRVSNCSRKPCRG